MDDNRRRGYLRAVNDLEDERNRIMTAYQEASAVYARRLEKLNERMARNVESMRLLSDGLTRDLTRGEEA